VQAYLNKLRDSTMKDFENSRCKDPRFIQHDIVKDWKRILSKPSYAQLADFKKNVFNDRLFDTEPDRQASPTAAPPLHTFTGEE